MSLSLTVAVGLAALGAHYGCGVYLLPSLCRGFVYVFPSLTQWRLGWLRLEPTMDVWTRTGRQHCR